MNRSEKVPQAMQETFGRLTEMTDAFCDEQLNGEYQQLIREATAALCRKRPSPLTSGRPNSWAAGIVHAIGMVNFLFDRSQDPHCSASDIYTYFGIASSTGSAKSKQVRDALKMRQFSPEWTLPSKIDDNPMVWMLEVNGLIVDVRYMPLEVQEIAYEKGIIPYVPGERE